MVDRAGGRGKGVGVVASAVAVAHRAARCQSLSSPDVLVVVGLREVRGVGAFERAARDRRGRGRAGGPIVGLRVLRCGHRKGPSIDLGRGRRGVCGERVVGRHRSGQGDAAGRHRLGGQARIRGGKGY